MNLNERFKKFPIKFYQTDKGIYFENPFLRGEAKDMTDAFNQIKAKNLDNDLFYYYDDVVDIKIGSFEPALKDKKTKQGIYLGKLNLDLDLNEVPYSTRTIEYIKNDPNRIKDHEKFIKKLKDAKSREEFLKKLKDGFKKVASYLKLGDYVTEMFSPHKTRYDLICEHCGDIIPIGIYYEEWQGKNYHLECIWDKLCNDKNSNEHEIAEKYFLSLQKLLKNWDEKLGCLYDYESDLELYKANKRRMGE